MFHHFRASRSSLTASFALVFALSASAHAAPLFVASDGTDSVTCGTKADPCRSITQGITNSAVGGDIVVGPGHYGDLDNDGVLGETGEEPVAACIVGSCLIDVNKQVSITSSDGAFATVIHPGPAAPDTVVGLDADGATFGERNKGFTIKVVGAPSHGILTYTFTGVVIAGNIIDSRGSLFGMYIGSAGTQVIDNRVLGGDTGYGIYVETDNAVLTGNVVTGSNLGITIGGTGSVLTGNVASQGIIGLVLSGTGTVVSKCSFLGNSTMGILAYEASATATVTTSNIVGNATGVANCGFNGNGSTITVKDSYWGSATGPGADPADATCNDVANSAVPFATKAIKVRVKGMR